MPKAEIDWDAIRAEYVIGKMSARALAEKYKLAESTVQRKATAEKWLQLRRDAASRAAKRALAAAEKESAAVAKKLQCVALQLLCKIEQRVAKMDAEDIRSFRDLTGALKDIAELQPTDGQESVQKIMVTFEGRAGEWDG